MLDDLDFVVVPGSRLGLIRENGAGMPTLLRLLAGLDMPDAGTVSVPVDVVYLAQEPPATAGTVDLLAAALRPLRPTVAEVVHRRASPASLPRRSGASSTTTHARSVPVVLLSALVLGACSPSPTASASRAGVECRDAVRAVVGRDVDMPISATSTEEVGERAWRVTGRVEAGRLAAPFVCGRVQLEEDGSPSVPVAANVGRLG